MEKIIFLKYAELSTKKDNINYFLKILYEDIKKNLGNLVNIKYDYGRMFIIPKNDNFEEVINKLQNIFGIHEIVVAYKLENKELDYINECLLEILSNKHFQTFKVNVKRSDKSYPVNGMELRKMFGTHILKNIKGIKVSQK